MPIRKIDINIYFNVNEIYNINNIIIFVYNSLNKNI